MSTALVVFAKAPEAGRAKTRLIPALGPEGAAALAGRLLRHAIGHALRVDVQHRELCVTPSTDHPAFARLPGIRSGRLQLTVQGDGDLGERMHRALERVLRSHQRALLIGTDAPDLDATRIAAARDALVGHDAVFIPALDGGYALVGLSRPAPELFLDMRWSTAQVMQHTRERAAATGLDWIELEPVADIDEPADLVRLSGAWLRCDG